MTTRIDQLHTRVQFTTPEGRLTPFAFKFLSFAWEKLGGPDNSVEKQELDELYPWTRFNHNISNIDVIVSSSDITTTGTVFLIITSNKEVTLNTEPEDEETVIVKRDTTAGNVTVTGPIDGDTEYIITMNYASNTFKYSAEQGKWYIV